MTMSLLACIETAAGLPPGTLTRADVETVAQEGDIDWVVVRLPDGRWAATDDAEVAVDRVAIFGTRVEALDFRWVGWRAVHRDDPPTARTGWRAEPPAHLRNTREWEVTITFRCGHTEPERIQAVSEAMAQTIAAERAHGLCSRCLAARQAAMDAWAEQNAAGMRRLAPWLEEPPHDGRAKP